MDDNATPPKKIRRTRPTHFPARLAIMTTEAQRAEIERIADRDDASLGETVRYLIAGGIVADAEAPS